MVHPRISAIFWDVGGVLLTNAWDHTQRAQAVQRFNLDEADFDDRHHMLVSSLERGKITLSEYLDRTVFYRERSFSGDDFRKFMFSLSQPNQEALDFAQNLARSGKYVMATLNNESKELNAYRIQTFRLREIFTIFVSSCFVGLRKPEEGIYRLALEITQKAPENCCFVDDRPLNLESAAVLGMQTVRMQSVTQLRRDMAALGIEA
jgi:putative hydrolase of the HAD superfamily